MNLQSKKVAHINMRRNAVAQACVTFSLLLATGAANAAAGFGVSNGPDGAAIRKQTYYAHSPTGKRAVNPPEANTLIPNYDGSTGAALRKFVDTLPQVNAASNKLSDGVTEKYIPAAISTKWKTPAGALTDDDYYEIAVIEYKEKMHTDLKPTTVRGYVQIDHHASNGRTPIKGQGATTYPLFYPLQANETTPRAIMIPATDALGKIIPGQMVQAVAVDKPHYLGPAIVATRGVATRLKFHNLLPVGRYNPTTGRNGDLFIPVDETLPGAGVGPDGVTRYTQNRAEIHLHGGDTPWVSDGTPHQWIAPAGEKPLLEAELKGAGSPEPVSTFMRGPGAQNVPDMNDPGEGAVTYYFPNRQSARLMWYHDHTYGLTRLNAYAGEAAPYVLSDGAQETALRSVTGFPNDIIHLVIQDKTFVPADIKLQDGRWNAKVVNGANVPLAGAPLWGEEGDLWYPHVYEVNQDPTNGLDGTNPVGRWDWGPYFWPVFPSLYNLPSGGVDDVTLTPEAWMDTPVVNGVAYPTLTVEPRAQRFQILNGANDRFWNLSFFLADSAVSEVAVVAGGSGYVTGDAVTFTGGAGKGASGEVVADATGQVRAIRVTNPGTGFAMGDVVTAAITSATGTGAALGAVSISVGTEVKMVPAAPIEATGLAACAVDANGVDIAPPYAPACLPSTWPTDGRAGGVPDATQAGPKIFQIGNEGGLLPQVAEIAAAPMQYEYNRRSVTVLNTFSHGLFMGNAERADIVVDFSGYEGKTLIMYSDAPAPVPAFDPRNDHWTGKPDETDVGSVDTPKAGFGPNTRTVMQIKVANSLAAAQALLVKELANQQQAAGDLAAALAAQATADAKAASTSATLATANTLVTTTQSNYMSAVATFTAMPLDTGNPTYWAALANVTGSALAYNQARDAAAAAQVAYDAALVAQAKAAADVTRTQNVKNNADITVAAAQAAVGNATPGKTFVPLDVAGLKTKLPQIYGDPLIGQEPPIVAQSGYNAAFGQSWSDAPKADGTKAFASIFTGSLQEPSFRFTPGTPNAYFDKLSLTNKGSGYIKAPKPVLSKPVDAQGTPIPDSVGAEAVTTLRVDQVVLNNPGAGYLFAPVVTFGNTSAGTGAQAVARMQVSKVLLTSAGSGYAPGDFPVTFSAPDSRVPGGVQATGFATADANGNVVSVTITNGGNGYTSAPLVALNGPNGVGTGAMATTELNIKSIDLVSNDPNHPEFAGGAGYDNLANVTVRITLPTGKNGTVAADATVTGAVADITLTNNGRGYLAAPSVTIPFPVDLVGAPVAGGIAAEAITVKGAGSILVKNKAIQELFDPTYGRMNATLGIEIPFTSALTQTTIPLGYADPVTEEFQDGETQIWKITHNGVDSHPVHFHLLNVQLINRVGWDGTVKQPAANELGWKETIRFNPLEDLVVAVRAKKPVLPGFGLPNSVRMMDPSQPEGVPMGFTQVDVTTGNPAVVTNAKTNLGWEYVWHCHILGHEENDFMRPVKFKANEVSPLAPAQLTVADVDNTATLNWVDVSQTEYKYEVTRRAIMADESRVAALPAQTLLANVSTASDAHPAIGGNVLTYLYTVDAVGATSTGSSSVAIPVNVLAPSNVTAKLTAAGKTSATVTWNDNSINETQFTVEQAQDLAGPWTVVQNVKSTNATGTGTQSAVVTGLPAGNYYFRVNANLASGTDVFATAQSAPSAVYAAPLVNPATPAAVALSVAPSSNLFTTTFQDVSVSETQFVVTATAGTTVTTLATIPSTTTVSMAGTSYSTGAIDLTNGLLAPNANYAIKVVAQDTTNNMVSAATASKTLNITTKPTAAAPAPVVTVTDPARTFTNMNRAFTMPNNTASTVYMPVTSFEVTYCKVTSNNVNAACADATTTVTVPASAPTINLGAALTGTNYYKYVIKASNLAGQSTGSKIVLSR